MGNKQSFQYGSDSRALRNREPRKRIKSSPREFEPSICFPGDFQVYRMYNENLDKEIFIVGEVHEDSPNSDCPSELCKMPMRFEHLLNKYLKRLYADQNMIGREPVDLFLEHDWQLEDVKKYKGAHLSPLLAVRQMMLRMKCLQRDHQHCVYKNVLRAHYIDARDKVEVTLRNGKKCFASDLHSVVTDYPDHENNDFLRHLTGRDLETFLQLNERDFKLRVWADNSERKKLLEIMQRIWKQKLLDIYDLCDADKTIFDVLKDADEYKLNVIQNKITNFLTVVQEVYAINRLYKPYVRRVIYMCGEFHIYFLIEVLREMGWVNLKNFEKLKKYGHIYDSQIDFCTMFETFNENFFEHYPPMKTTSSDEDEDVFYDAIE